MAGIKLYGTNTAKTCVNPGVKKRIYAQFDLYVVPNHVDTHNINDRSFVIFRDFRSDVVLAQDD